MVYNFSFRMEVDGNIIDEFTNLTEEDSEFTKKCVKVAQDVTSAQLTILSLVEQLGPFLTNQLAEKRALGTWILTRVLQNLPPTHFDQKQLHFVCAFYADRLKDNHQVIPAVLLGIVALSKFHNFPEGAAGPILTSLFHNVSCQQQQEQDRGNIYRIFDAFLDQGGEMGFDFVYGVINAVDGERNPKNLILLFNWFPKFFKKVTLGHLAEEAFEVLACYFPVDFKAPTNESNVITRDQLATALAPCLAAIPQFSEFCFSLALEKLDSSLEIAKIDSLKLLEIGCRSFDVSSYVQHITEIWSQIQKEIFSCHDPLIVTACLSTLTSVIRKISTHPSINGTVKDISDTMKGNLLPDSKLFDQSAKILLSIAAASLTTSDLIVKEIAPILINVHDMSKTKSHKGLILKTLVNFFDSYVTFHDQIEFEELQKIPILCLRASLDDNNELKEVAFNSLSQIAKFLNEDIRLSLYDNLQMLILTQMDPSITLSVRAMAKHFPNETKEKLVNNYNIDNKEILEAYLSALCVIATDDFYAEAIVKILLHYLYKNVDLGQIVMSSMKNMILQDNDKFKKKLVDVNIISTLVDWSIKNDNLDFNCLQNVASVLKTLIGEEEAENQRNIMVRELPKIDLLRSTRVFLLDGILCHLRRDVQIDYEILNDLTHLIVTKKNPVKNTAAQLLANLLNKCNNETVLLSYLNSNNKTDLTLMTWITKALVMRNHALANQWTDNLIKLLGNDKTVAESFRVIMDDNIDSLSVKSYSVRSLLYRQKIFTAVTKILSENYRPDLDSYLLAVGYLLEKAPKQVVLLQFRKILKLVILCLDTCDEPEILIVILQMIKDFIIEGEKCIEDNFDGFLTRCLKLSMFDKSMKVRVLALHCLQECTSHFPVYKLLVHKPQVLQILGKVVDDKKRIVRREAVEARSLWFILDAPI